MTPAICDIVQYIFLFKNIITEKLKLRQTKTLNWYDETSALKLKF